MEPRIYLTALVLAVGGLHLVCRLVDVVSRFHAASSRARTGTHKAAVKRDDWYMFFHCSDLTGDKKETVHPKRTEKETSSSQGARLRSDSRPSARRYIS
ncbi:MAG: hypothetical protein ACI8ZB_001360 [Desulforhopalus sp.]|jgi:hypothetical protein